MKRAVIAFLFVPMMLVFLGFSPVIGQEAEPTGPAQVVQEKKDFIKWIDFNVPHEVIKKAQKNHGENSNVFEVLAYVALRNANSFNVKSDVARITRLMQEIEKGDTSIIDKVRDNKYFKHYLESYRAILGGIICEESGKTIGYHPIAKGHWYTCGDDFGNSRSYGFKRKHLGHDIYGSVGAPLVAVEGGTITELGWNRYGGWRVGIRSECTKRYYYYAHLRKDKPFAEGLKKGDMVEAGQLIGYLGRTGYSRKENVNMKEAKPHLHFGLQIIFDKSQEDGAGEIWVDLHAICRVLSAKRVVV